MWRVDGARVRALRMQRMLTIHDFAQKSGVAERTVADIERAESGRRPETIRCLAKALGVAPEDLLVRDAGVSGAPPAAPSPEAAHAPPSSIALPPLKLPPRTHLDRLADYARAHAIAPPPLVVGKARIDVLMPPRMQDLFARHAAFDKKRFVVVGHVERQRALSVEEARALGTKVGIGAKFNVLAEVAPGMPFSVTVFAPTAKLADALQAKVKEAVRVVVEVRVVGKNDARVVSLFASQRKRAWAFVAAQVID